jgi:hypothetical protein
VMQISAGITAVIISVRYDQSSPSHMVLIVPVTGHLHNIF